MEAVPSSPLKQLTTETNRNTVQKAIVIYVASIVVGFLENWNRNFPTIIDVNSRSKTRVFSAVVSETWETEG